MRAPALQLLSFSMESLKEVKHSEPGSFRASIGQFLNRIHQERTAIWAWELQSFNWSLS